MRVFKLAVDTSNFIQHTYICSYVVDNTVLKGLSLKTET
jgi:hypothetical protein